ncbi:MAG: DUF4350 domain-containing protein [Planctomycetaceae bacterium]|nr:DUF4350 domain-containing protein [Planctomycetaceae bacterium]
MLLLVALFMGGAGSLRVFAQEAESSREAESQLATIDSVEVGTKGVYKVGLWTPAKVTFSTESPGSYHLELMTVDADGAPFATKFKPQQITEPGTHVLKGKFLPGRMEADLIVRLYRDEILQVERSFPSSKINPDSLPVAERQSLFLIGLIQAEKEAAEDNETESAWPENFIEEQLKTLETSKPTRAIQLASLDELPDELETLQVFDSLIISDGFDVPPEQEKRLQQWVQAGGHLMILVGDEVDQWQAGSLSKWVPVQIEGLINLKHLGDLENYVGQGRLARMIMDVAHIRPENLDAQVEVASIEGPLVVQASYGFGVISVSAIDVTREPLASWESLPLFFQKVLARVPSEEEKAKGRKGKNLVHTGVSTFRTQLQGTIDQFKKTRNLTAWEVMVRILGLIFLLGPLDYLLTHKLLKRPGLTWISFPLMLGIVILVALRSAESMHHQSPLLREVSLIDHDVRNGLSHYHVWQSYYSPRSERVDIEVDPQETSSASEAQYILPPRTRWSGVPEESFSGMYRSPGISLGMPAYELSLEESQLTGIPIGQWSSKVLETEWLSQDIDKVLVESDLKTNSSGRLRGSLKHHFPVPLTQWFIAYESQVYLPSEHREMSDKNAIQPEEPFSLDGRDVRDRMIKNYLTDRSEERDSFDQKNLSRALREYQADSTDPYKIFRAATFYEIIGGQDYYNLSNESLAGGDCSERVKMKRAVLYGTLELPVAKTSVNGESLKPDFQKTLIRIVLPVE